MILIIILIILILWYLVNLFFFYNKTNFILGQDYQMRMEKIEDEKTNYPIVYFDFKEEIKDLYDILRKKCKNSLIRKNHPLRMSTNENQTRFEYLDLPNNEIVDFTFCKIKNKNDISENQIIEQTIKNPNKVKFFVHDKGYIVSFSHLLYDGINAFQVSQSYCDNYDKIKLPFFTYIPIYFEYLIMKSGLKYLLNPIVKNLTYDFNLSKNMHLKINLNDFKKLKNSFKNKVNFSFLLISIQLYAIFNSLDESKNKLTVGIVMAFSNKTRRNNFTALPVVITKPAKDLNIIDYISNILNQIEYQYNKNSHYITSIYTFTNVYDAGLKVNSYVDLLVSGFPMCKTNQFSINNIGLKDTKTIFRHTSMPLYLYHMSDLNNIYLSYNIKTKEIDICKMEKNLEVLENFLVTYTHIKKNYNL